MPRIASYVEYAANVVTGVLVAAVAVVVVHRVRPPGTTTPAVRRVDLRRSLPIDFTRAQRTLVIVLDHGCPYCTASLPFYRTLMTARDRQDATLQIAVAVPERETDTVRDLAAQGVEPDVVTHFRIGALPVVVVPTLLLAGPAGELIAMWAGALSANQEQRVLHDVFGKK